MQTTKTYSTWDTSAAAQYNFIFSADIPSAWQVEAVDPTQALNFYDPKASGSGSLNKSQIFMRTFQASQFLTLDTVDIFLRTQSQIAGRAAVTYEIEKKAGVPNFANQPAWRNQRHFVTDIRTTTASPTVFYVIAKNPDLPNEVFNQFLNSLDLVPTRPN